MAITRAQIARELYKNGKRVGLKGGADASTFNNPNKSVNVSSSGRVTTSNKAPSGPDRTRTSDRQDYNTAIATGKNPLGIDLSKGPPPLTEKEKQFVKDNPPKRTLADFFDRRKQAYNFARSLPGAKKSSYNNLVAYRNYLKSQGADLSTIDRLMEGVDEENAIGFDPFQELAYDYEPKGITDIETLRDLFGSVDESEKYKPPTTGMGPFDKITAVPQNFSDFMLTQRNNPTLFAAGDLGNFMDKPKPKDLVNPNTGELYTNAEWNSLKQDIGQDRGLIGGGRDSDNQTDPCLGPNPPAYCAVNNDPADPATPTRNLGGLAPRFAGSIFDFTGLANGGRAGMMDGGMMEDTPEGGIMDLESGRQMYFLGKLVKKATRAVKKVAKSPFGKAALGAALFKFGGGFGGGSGTGILSKLKTGLIGTLSGGEDNIFKGGKFSGLANFLRDQYTSDGGKLKFGLGLGLGVPFALDMLGVGKDKDDGFDIDEYYRTAGLGGQSGIDAIRLAGIDGLANRFKVADGGRINYAEGSDEPVAKKTMPLLDMDGKEMDLREDGGFVPLGRMERADDVPARLSKNEFVFTADAVRNAGEGDIDKGAEVMYNMMKNLESGGEVSEESQGLEGAREMFQTSQRLEEVL